MENDQVKMHSMISSVVSAEGTAIEKYQKLTDKHQLSAVKTIKDAMLNPSPCLVTMKQKDPVLTSNILKLMIARTARSFNLPNGKNIEPAQIECLVEDLLEEFYFLKLSDIYLVLKNARLGRIGKTFERMDQPTIWKWFDDHVAERMQIAVDESLTKHDQATHDQKDRHYDGYISKLFTESVSEQNKKVMNIAYGMAKKMTANAVQTPVVIQSTLNESKTQSKKK